MSYLAEVELGQFPPFAALQDYFGYVPGLFRAQTLLPRLIDAETGLIDAVLMSEQALSRIQKEFIVLSLAAELRNQYCLTEHDQLLQLLGVPEQQLDRMIAGRRQAGLSPADTALLDFALKLGRHGSVSQEDMNGLLANGFTDESVLEAILTTALARFLCTLSIGTGVTPDFEPRQPLPGEPDRSPSAEGSSEPYVGAVPPIKYHSPPLGALTRRQKEYIFLVCSAANLSTYCVTAHCEMVRMLGLEGPEPEQIAVDHTAACSTSRPSSTASRRR